MAAGINHYKADLRDMRFVLLEQFGTADLLGKAPFANFGVDECGMVLDEVYRFACEVTGPLNAIGDQQGCRVEDGRVKTPTGYKNAWTKLYEAGWATLSMPEKYGGQGAPQTLSALAAEMLSGSNPAFNMYPGLALGAAEVIEHFGTDRQKALFVRRMLDGTWGGTMCLTEAHAGSDVGAASTTAERTPEGLYRIKGTKIFISGGDHDLAENVIHLVLARVTGAPAGTKGLSLFIVPRLRVADDGTTLGENDVHVPSIEHKMGINGSATCVVNFGDEGACLGELVGNVENHGMMQMFKMMNGARISVGIQGVAVASSAFLNALSYARDRRQGSSIKNFKDPSAPRAAILEHPNVRQDLLDMKSRVEGIRAMIQKLAYHQDLVNSAEQRGDGNVAYHQGQVDLLTPLVKAYASDQAFRVCEKAIQVHGGMGFTRDFPVEQSCRDSKIFSIYEGTNAIQSMDLVTRKLMQNGGANAKAFFDDVARFVEEHAEHPELAASVGELKKAHAAVGQTGMHFMQWFTSGQLLRVPLASERFLEMMAELCVGWLLLDQAQIALAKLPSVPDGHADRHFYAGKRAAAVYYARNVLPAVVLKSKTIAAGDTSAVDLADEAFATV